jgi:hypothetical protein
MKPAFWFLQLQTAAVITANIVQALAVPLAAQDRQQGENDKDLKKRIDKESWRHLSNVWRS